MNKAHVKFLHLHCRIQTSVVPQASQINLKAKNSGLAFRSWKRSKEAHQSLIRLFYTTSVTVLQYGCDSWVLSVNIADREQDKCICHILLQDHAEHQTSWLCLQLKVHEMTNTQPLINTVRQRQQHFLGHILRTLENDTCTRYASMFQLMAEEG